MALWYFICFIACVYLNTSIFDYKKRRYQPFKWEENGKWYEKHLYIKKWKDKLPQHIGKDGFSKANFKSTSIEYIDEFIMETCRGEWNHSLNCFFIVIILAIIPSLISILFSILTLLINIPFIVIQRYNRFRLIKIKNTKIQFELKNKSKKSKEPKIN